MEIMLIAKIIVCRMLIFCIFVIASSFTGLKFYLVYTDSCPCKYPGFDEEDLLAHFTITKTKFADHG